MIKKIFFTFLLLLLLPVNSYSAGSSDNSKTKTNYDKAVTHIKLAKKYEKKNKIKKANKSNETSQMFVSKALDDTKNIGKAGAHIFANCCAEKP